MRPTMEELEHRCQKTDHRRIGNWMARKIARPLALRVTWLILPAGISAHAMTLAALLTALCAAAAFGGGTVEGWILGAGLLQLWYLLDHVDGQLARLHGTASLDGVGLDYLMHHLVNLVLPLAIGFGLFSRHGETLWLAAGLLWSIGLAVLGLIHDVRYKSFIQRLKLVEGQLLVQGGGGARSEPPPPIPRRPRQLIGWFARKACETHVWMNALTLLAAVTWGVGDQEMWLAQGYTLCMCLWAPLLAGAQLLRATHSSAAEQEFRAWFRVPPGHALEVDAGRWIVKNTSPKRQRVNPEHPLDVR